MCICVYIYIFFLYHSNGFGFRLSFHECDFILALIFATNHIDYVLEIRENKMTMP